MAEQPSPQFSKHGAPPSCTAGTDAIHALVWGSNRGITPRAKSCARQIAAKSRPTIPTRSDCVPAANAPQERIEKDTIKKTLNFNVIHEAFRRLLPLTPERKLTPRKLCVPHAGFTKTQ